MELISSRQNSAVKRIRALRNRRARAEEGAFFAEGIRSLIEAVDVGHPVDLVVLCPEMLSSDGAEAAVGQLVAAGVPRLSVSADVFATLSDRDHPQGVGIVAPTGIRTLDAIDPNRGICWVALMSPQDPGNVGSIIRSCDAVDAAGIILVGDSVDPYESRSIRASMGSIFSRHIVRAEATELRTWAHAKGCTLVGASVDASGGFRNARFHRPMVLVMGSEREGLSPTAIGMCDDLVSLPMPGRADSLNLAVATSVILYEILRQVSGSDG